MKQILVTVVVPYAVEFIRRGCQKTEGLIVWDKGPIAIVEAASSETETAFSIGPSGALNQAYDILSFDGKLWWPLRDGAKPLSVEAFIDGTDDPDGFFLATLNLSPATLHSTRQVTRSRFDADHSIRQVDVSSRDERWTLAHRAASRLLFCDGAVYQEAGPPAYFGTRRPGAAIPTLSLRIGRLPIGGSQPAERWHHGISANIRQRAARQSCVFSVEDIGEISLALRADGVIPVLEEQVTKATSSADLGKGLRNNRDWLAEELDQLKYVNSPASLSPADAQALDEWLLEHR